MASMITKLYTMHVVVYVPVHLKLFKFGHQNCIKFNLYIKVHTQLKTKKNTDFQVLILLWKCWNVLLKILVLEN